VLHHTTPRRPSSLLRLAVAGVAALVLAACGGDGGNGGSSAAVEDGVFSLVGQDNLQWDVTEASAPAGELTFELTCEDGVNHNVVIEETDEEVAACLPGQTASGTVNLDAGTYTYVCTVPGHERTMRGELTMS
jgi:cytochrome c oxidase subunit 2